MTAKQIIDRVNEIKPNAFTDDVKLKWLNELEGRIAAKIFLMAPAEIKQTELSMTDTPMAEPPYDDMYAFWLEAKTDEANGEYDRYQNSMQMFDSAWREFLCWFGQTWDPAQGYINEERRREYGAV